MDSTKGSGKPGAAAAGKEDTTNATVDMKIQEELGVSRDQIHMIMMEAAKAGGLTAQSIAVKAATDYLAAVRPEIETRTEEIANKAVAEALARKQKASTLKTYGAQAAVSAGVFIAGTLAMIGVDKFRHRNDKRANEMNPQYQAANA